MCMGMRECARVCIHVCMVMRRYLHVMCLLRSEVVYVDTLGSVCMHMGGSSCGQVSAPEHP